MLLPSMFNLVYANFSAISSPREEVREEVPFLVSSWSIKWKKKQLELNKVKKMVVQTLTEQTREQGRQVHTSDFSRRFFAWVLFLLVQTRRKKKKKKVLSQPIQSVKTLFF